MDKLKNLMFIFPVMFYYLMESAIVAIFINVIWRYFIENIVGIEINYLEWVAIIWVIKVVFFDVFKLIGGLNSAGSNMQNEINNFNQQQ